MPGVRFQYGGQDVLTVDVLDTKTVDQLQQGEAPRILMLQDIDGVWNLIGLTGLDWPPKQWQFLIDHGCVFCKPGEAYKDTAAFTLLQKQVLEQIGPVFEILSLCPVFGSQRLAAPPARVDLYSEAQSIASHSQKIPGFQYFAPQHIDGARAEVLTVLAERLLYKMGYGIFGLVKLVKKVRELVPDDESQEYEYIRRTISFIGELVDPGRRCRMYMPDVQKLIACKQALFPKGVRVDPVPFENYRRLDLCAVDHPAKLTPAELEEHDSALKACMDAVLITDDGSPAPDEYVRKLQALDDLCATLISFGKQVMGDAYQAAKYIDRLFFTNIKIERTDGVDVYPSLLDTLGEEYFRVIEHYDTEDKSGNSTLYFKALFDLYVEHVQTSAQMSESARQGHDQKIEGELSKLRAAHTKLQPDQLAEIENRVDLSVIQKMWNCLFHDFSVYHTNSDKSALAHAWQGYLRRLEPNVKTDESCILMDDSHCYAVSIKSIRGEFIHAEIHKIYDELPVKNLDGLISSDMLQPHLQQLLLFRPPLMVLALLATKVVEPHPDGQQDLVEYKKKIAVNLVEHKLFDAAIVACLLSDAGENIEAFKTNILDPLVAAASDLGTNRILCNRLAVQFFNDVVLHGLGYLPPVAKAMLTQASAMNQAVSVSFLLARLFKAICWDIRSFYPTAPTLEKLVESFAMIGLDDGNVLQAYDVYDQTLLSHIKTMVDVQAEARLRDYLTRDVAPGVPKAAFNFHPDIEIHYLLPGAAHAVYDQLFCVGEAGEVRTLAGHNSLVLGNQIWGVFNSEGLLVFNNGRQLSTAIDQPIRGAVARFSIDTTDRGIILSLHSSHAAFCVGSSNTFDPNSIMLLSDGGDSLNTPGRRKAAYQAMEARAQILTLDPLLQAQAYGMARVVFHYSQDPHSLTPEEALDAMRLLTFLNNASKNFAAKGYPRFRDFAGLLGKIPTLGQQISPILIRRIKILGIPVLGCILFAVGYDTGVQDPFFVANYNEQILNIFNRYVLPSERSSIALNYAGVAAVLAAAMWKIKHFIASFKHSPRETAMRQLLANAAGLDAIRQALIYLNHQDKVTGGDPLEQELIKYLLELYAALDRNLLVSHGLWGRYKISSAANPTMQGFSLPYSQKEQQVIRWTGFFKDTALPVIAIVLGGLSIYHALNNLKDPTIADVAASNILVDVMKLAVVVGGRFGMDFIWPLLMGLVFFLPDGFLVEFTRGVTAVYEFLFLGGDQQEEARAIRGSTVGYGSFYGVDNSLTARLLPQGANHRLEEEEQEEGHVVVNMTATAAGVGSGTNHPQG